MTSPPSPSPSSSTTLDGLPKQFVSAMRTLFDLMDDRRTGSVDLAEIELRWQEEDAGGLPSGLLDSLRKVTPPGGALSFERFCAGLKICLLRHQAERAAAARPPSAPLAAQQDAGWGGHQRALSLPQLGGTAGKGGGGGGGVEGGNGGRPSTAAAEKPAAPLLGPPKPPRTALGLDRAEIRTALQQWQMGLMMGEQDHKGGTEKRPYAGGLLRPGRSMGDGKASVPPEGGIYQKKANARRREPRRHTLQNGIDYNMLKRMKQIEQEKEVLMLGLAAVEKARDWYLKQVAVVQEKMKYLGRMGHMEHWSEAQQERLELQRARVIEVNRHLATLTESWERGGLPLHMNLAVHHYPQTHHPPQDMTSRLKQQNRLLTEEVSKKSERISALEREKANLIQFLQTRSVPPNRINVQEEAVF